MSEEKTEEINYRIITIDDADFIYRNQHKHIVVKAGKVVGIEKESDEE